MRQLLDEAAKGGYGVGAFNVNNMELLQAIVEACEEEKAPVMLQISKGARHYANPAWSPKRGWDWTWEWKWMHKCC